MSMANDEQNNLTKYIKEFKTETKPKNNSNLKKVKEDVLNSTITRLKGRKMVFKAFESGIFLKPEKLKQSEQSEQSNQSSSNDKYTSLKLDNDLNTLNKSFSSNSDISLFTPKKRKGLKILTPK